ncbi:MAG: NfeD family protein [Kiritimatiellia bacterium]
MTELYFILLIAGVLLIGAEVFVPDGILGTIGAMFLLGTAALGFIVFPPTTAALALVGTIALVCVTIFIWARFFPKTPVGKRMMVSTDLKAAHASDESLPALLGQLGIVTAELRPSGYAEINGRRIDVISASGDLIPIDTKVEVVRVEGYRVLVDPIPAPQSQS